MPLSLLSVPALLHNYRLLAEKTAGTLIPVVKANAYGHGAMPVVRALLGEGASLFAVASAAEAKELLPLFHENIPNNDNQRFTNIGVLIMGPAEDEAVLPLMRGRAVFAVHSLPYARRLCALLSK